MSQKLSELIVLILGGSIAGITFEKWIELAAAEIVEHSKLIFSISLLTSLFATGWIALFLMINSNRLFGKIAVGLTVLVTILWLACVIVVCTRKWSNSTIYELGMKTPDTVLSIICLIISIVSTIALVLLGALKG